MKKYDISKESSRTYSYTFFDIAEKITHKVIQPLALYYESGHAFHRVWDGAKVYLLHAPGPIRDMDGNTVGVCFMSWIPKNPDNPCQF